MMRLLTLWSDELCPRLRRIDSLWARAASLGNVPPKATPGRAVRTSPVTLRMFDGAVILGTNVSIWLGPPPATATPRPGL
jgi:hypothetical protein